VTDMMDSLDQVREITCPRKREAGPIYDAFVWLVAFWAHARWAAPTGRLKLCMQPGLVGSWSVSRRLIAKASSKAARPAR